MHSTTDPLLKNTAGTGNLASPDIKQLLDQKDREIIDLRRQIAWFQRQMFGQKSEKRSFISTTEQGVLGEEFQAAAIATPDTKTRIAAHGRSAARKPDSDDTALFFDEKTVPVQTITLVNPETENLAADAYDIISEKISYRLAQRPGSYVILKYVRPVIKLRATEAISCPPAPVAVIDGSRADVSFIAGMLIDKFLYHQPLYRQHQHCQDAGIRVSRPWLTQLGQHAVALLEAIYDAQLASIQASRVKAMDETPIKAGTTGTGKMNTAYFWPVYGEQDEICFLYYPGRSARHVQDALGLSPPPGAVLQTDGYSAYAHYAHKTGITHAQCWAHARRKIMDAQDMEPERAKEALDQIAQLYKIEARIREQNLSGAAKQAVRLSQSRPVADRYFSWVDKQFERQGFLPSSPFMKALAYSRERREGLEVYLHDPEVAIDTNHLERALRVIPMGKKNWLFSWTELGARQIGIVQSLLVTCRLHDISPYDYLVDVLQRISVHPDSKIHELTPRLWKQHFADDPLRSDLHLFSS